MVDIVASGSHLPNVGNSVLSFGSKVGYIPSAF